MTSVCKPLTRVVKYADVMAKKKAYASAKEKTLRKGRLYKRLGRC